MSSPGRIQRRLACSSNQLLISRPSASPQPRIPTILRHRPVSRWFGSVQGPRSPQPSESHLMGPNKPPLFEHNLAFHWDKHILPNYHDQPALISRAEPPSPTHQPGRKTGCLRLSYSQLDQSINAVAFGLHQLGIRKGDRVGINTPTHSIFPILQWATSRIGAILATINPAYAPSELANVLKKVDCKVLFSTPSFKSKDMVPVLSSLIQEIPSLTHLVIVDNESHQPGKRSKSEILEKFHSTKSSSSSSSVIDLEQVIQQSSSSQQFPILELQADEVINLQFTSGTTGLPKAVSLTHRNLLNNAHHIADRTTLTSKDSLCNVPPLFHCFGSVIGNLASFVKGATVVFPSETFDPDAVIRTVSEERCTVLNGVGTMFLAELNVLDRMKDVDMSCLRTGVVAGSPVSAELMNRIEDRLGIKELTILYGMTETSPGTFQTRPTDERSKRTATVGTIYPHTQAKVVDLATREVVKRGQRGELLVSGYSVQKGYWNDPLETAKAMITDQEGRVWMQSGDIASIDEDGYLKIVGRAKEVIIRGGENLYPVVIENCIIKLDGVVSVAVVGAKDEFYGEVVGAFVKRKPASSKSHSSPSGSERTTADQSVTEEDIRSIVKTNMAGANIPKYVWFLDSIGQVDFPMTGSGKIKKTELALWVQDLLSNHQNL
ncbi:hypothetical protein PGT21_003283 [Puccinia graminis f. sp. tritici]|uniref:AMP-dependent synthetase/ligase domain-containing protein n=1 Tax=Puccinia graminis f. sp. tritici TaxID=56615 RepID=A0A5B0SGM0_PUCGR|nr:hypothetical protein PGT21_003283 [Puccinia graminis f. sp. tritici]KAA1137158.1 hypothetical protein PGTUg99_006574 [Puccinia graminis f. sp. tritici]